ncbi:hypothetical protein KA005_08525 [bacterium]|nr:hypothetical protein [bacterium]
MIKDNPMIECACGCGKLRSKYNSRGKEMRYISGHNKSFSSRKHTDKTKKQMSENHPDISGENNYFFGKHHTKKSKKKISDAKSGMKLTAEHKKKISDRTTGDNNPFHGKTHTDESKKKISKNNGRWNLGRHRSNEVKKKISDAQKGEKSYHWRGGLSFEPYCLKFNTKFKESIRDQFNRTCFLCSITEQESMNEMRLQGKRAFKLSIHHVNYNKECLCDDSYCEFVPLCHSCHGKTQGDREYWENLIIEKLQSDDYKKDWN